MHTLARHPVREDCLKTQARLRAFTLIELLLVIAIIGILSAITLGVVGGVNRRAAVGRAKAELSVISGALEAYKLQYGDYPQAGITPSDPDPAKQPTLANTHSNVILLNALVGKLGPKARQIDAMNGRSVLELSKVTLENDNMPANDNVPVLNALVDPWGRRYLYYYRTTADSNSWSKSYVLYSVGPDGLNDAPSFSGSTLDLQSTSAKNSDNIYSDR